MGQDKLHLNDWIVQLALLIDDLESEREPRRRLISLTARLGLKNWLVYRANPRAATVEHLPVNAVVAGCLQEYIFVSSLNPE
jgi:hypothetical protein